MPNGFYPVPGLDVLRIHRSEQGYPRTTWSQFWDQCWAVTMTGPQGYAPQGPLRLPSHTPSFDDVVEAARGVLAADATLSQTAASAMWLDFKQREGGAVGEFCAYGFKDGKVHILHDLSVGAQAPPEFWQSDGAHHFEHPRVFIEPSGLKSYGQLPPSFRFRFDDMHELAVSSVPLHYTKHWPPKNILDMAMLALCRSERRDILMALWKRDE
ncbi:MAG: hypothetical protein JNJ46_34570 [Myxococcales bacterium]|nr:hypothetical protein [Myxococcales bacterium]